MHFRYTLLVSYLSLTGEVFTGYSWGIRRLYICIGYVSGMYRVCVGKVSKDTMSEE